MKELKMSLPDDRPVTALAIVEESSRCPSGYTIVSKTYDTDQDADLWKDGFFGKRTTRYLCLSKTEGPSGFVIDSLCIINERDSIPNGFVLMSKTYGSGIFTIEKPIVTKVKTIVVSLQSKEPGGSVSSATD